MPKFLQRTESELFYKVMTLWPCQRCVKDMEKMTAMLLMLVMLGALIAASQAVTCYFCLNCDPTSSTLTCTGEVCAFTKFVTESRFLHSYMH